MGLSGTLDLVIKWHTAAVRSNLLNFEAFKICDLIELHSGLFAHRHFSLKMKLTGLKVLKSLLIFNTNSTKGTRKVW